MSIVSAATVDSSGNAASISTSGLFIDINLTTPQTSGVIVRSEALGSEESETYLDYDNVVMD